MSGDVGMFGDLAPTTKPDPYAGMGRDAKRTARQAEKLAAGIHPSTGYALHRDAAPADDRDAPGLRCGSCAHRWQKRAGGFTGSKCERARLHDGPDLRLWWPACIDYAPGGVS